VIRGDLTLKAEHAGGLSVSDELAAHTVNVVDLEDLDTNDDGVIAIDLTRYAVDSLVIAFDTTIDPGASFTEWDLDLNWRSDRTSNIELVLDGGETVVMRVNDVNGMDITGDGTVNLIDPGNALDDGLLNPPVDLTGVDDAIAGTIELGGDATLDPGTDLGAFDVDLAGNDLTLTNAQKGDRAISDAESLSGAGGTLTITDVNEQTVTMTQDVEAVVVEFAGAIDPAADPDPLLDPREVGYSGDTAVMIQEFKAGSYDFGGGSTGAHALDFTDILGTGLTFSQQASAYAGTPTGDIVAFTLLPGTTAATSAPNPAFLGNLFFDAQVMGAVGDDKIFLIREDDLISVNPEKAGIWLWTDGLWGDNDVPNGLFNNPLLNGIVEGGELTQLGVIYEPEDTPPLEALFTSYLANLTDANFILV
jgi:hypothetical protein